MKTLKLFTILIISCFSFRAYGSEQLPQIMRLPALTQGELTRDSFNGHRSVVIFWASWCMSCSKAMKAVKAWSKTQQESYQLVLVSVDEDIASARQYFSEPTKKDVADFISFSYFDGEALLAKSLEIEGIPSVAWLDDRGKIVYQAKSLPNLSDFEKAEKAFTGGL